MNHGKIGFYLLFLLSFLYLNAGELSVQLATDKARYLPEETVALEITSNPAQKAWADICVYNIDQLVVKDRIKLSAKGRNTWQWKTPDTDFQGYLIEVTVRKRKTVLAKQFIAVDVSSNWSKYIRYGFLSHYDEMTSEAMDAVLKRMNRLHISGIQFYDYHYMHHDPVKTDASGTAPTWPDIAQRQIHSATVRSYVEKAHTLNMTCMAYNLIYGAWECGLNQDVDPNWILYRDKKLKQPYKLDFPDSWADDIVFMDPANSGWQDYLIHNTEKVRLLDFDGWHVDQIGDIRPVYNQHGKAVELDAGFKTFLQKAKTDLAMPLVMNAVNQYGQEYIAASGAVDFLYTEVWDPHVTFSDLIDVINTNNRLSQNKKATVLAAYMNYKKSGEKGSFNTPGVLLADAVIFASGAAHLEIGEHMLCHEYFPNNNLKILPELDDALVRYYDFMTVYETLLRDSRKISEYVLDEGKNPELTKDPEKGKVWVLQKETEKYIILHLVNFTSMNDMNWRDPDGTCPEPRQLAPFPIILKDGQKITKVLAASPDDSDLRVKPVDFTNENSELKFQAPPLKYWNMIILEKGN